MKIIYLYIFVKLMSSSVILKEKEGFEIASLNKNTQFDVFFDVHCPNSSDFYGDLQEILNSSIGDKKIKELISFKIHIFPLPYHHNSFLASMCQKFIEVNYP